MDLDQHPPEEHCVDIVAGWHKSFPHFFGSAAAGATDLADTHEWKRDPRWTTDELVSRVSHEIDHITSVIEAKEKDKAARKDERSVAAKKQADGDFRQGSVYCKSVGALIAYRSELIGHHNYFLYHLDHDIGLYGFHKSEGRRVNMIFTWHYLMSLYELGTHTPADILGYLCDSDDFTGNTPLLELFGYSVPFEIVERLCEMFRDCSEETNPFAENNDEGEYILHLVCARETTDLRCVQLVIDMYPPALICLTGRKGGVVHSPLDKVKLMRDRREDNASFVRCIRENTRKWYGTVSYRALWPASIAKCVSQNQSTVKCCFVKMKEEGMTAFVSAPTTCLNDLTQPQFAYMVVDMMKNCGMQPLAELVVSYMGGIGPIIDLQDDDEDDDGNDKESTEEYDARLRDEKWEEAEAYGAPKDFCARDLEGFETGFHVGYNAGWRDGGGKGVGGGWGDHFVIKCMESRRRSAGVGERLAGEEGDGEEEAMHFRGIEEIEETEDFQAVFQESFQLGYQSGKLYERRREIANEEKRCGRGPNIYRWGAPKRKHLWDTGKHYPYNYFVPEF